MSNIFTRIKNQLNQDFGGRYLGAILEQVIAEVPDFAKHIFPGLPTAICRKLKNGDARVSAEKSFVGVEGNTRRSDLAIVEAGKILALAEVKYEDHLSTSNYAQIKDYIALTRKRNGPFFTYITQYAPGENDNNLIKEAREINDRICHLYYRDIYRSSRTLDNPVIRWFREFLMEEHVVYEETFGENALGALKLLMVKGLFVKHAHGLRKLSSSSNIPIAADLLGGLVGNASALSDWFYGSFRKHFGNSFVPEFGFDPEFDVRRIAKQIDNNEGKNQIYLDRGARTGGYFWVGASGRLKGKGGYVWFGYFFYLNLLTKKVSATIEAHVWQSDAINWIASKSFVLKDNLGLAETKAQQLVLATVFDSLCGALSDKNLSSGLKKPLLLLKAAVKRVRK